MSENIIMETQIDACLMVNIIVRILNEMCWPRPEDVTSITVKLKDCLTLVIQKHIWVWRDYSSPKRKPIISIFQAGEYGISEGSDGAARLIKKGYSRNIKSEVAAEFYEKAGDMGQFISYSSAADISVVLGRYHKAKSLYLKQGSKGNPSGYIGPIKMVQRGFMLSN